MKKNSSGSGAILEIKNLSVVYRHRVMGRVYAMSDVSLSVNEGEALGIAGESGCGKSTLLKSILRLFNPWEIDSVSGEILYDGCDILKMTPPELRVLRRGGISMIFQHPYAAFNPVIKIGRQLDETIRLYGCRREAHELLETCGLDERIPEMFPHNLSGGQLQRVLIARALVSDPAALFLDEPTTAMDAASQTNLLDLLAGLQERMSIVTATHDPTFYAQSYRHIACLNTRLYYHERGDLDSRTLEKIYGCPVEILGHGIPHTFLASHGETEKRP
ncbi:dipeptide/oligopeptide/nickel ABC transporter ATP-binding protein [bacterium]|nr:dipeptide/oligopeptide/nickel ABC transporter ATP-binding protein [bacterium]